MYKDNVAAVNAYYRDAIVEIDGTRAMDAVFEQVEAALDARLPHAAPAASNECREARAATG